MKNLLALLTVATCSPACSSATSASLAWRGAAPHFVAQGQVNGAPLAIDLEAGPAADASVLSCHRFYEAPVTGGTTIWSEGRLFRLEVDVVVASRVLQLSISPQGFPIDAQGTIWKLVPPDRQALADGQAQLEWAWLQAPDLDSTYQATAEGGSVDVELFSGTPDASGLVVPAEQGTLGALVVAHWSTTDEVSISLSAPCTTNRIERIVEGS